MWKLDHKEGWVLKSCNFWIVVLKKTLQSHLDCKEIKSINPKGDQAWIFIRWTDAEAEAQIFWSPDKKSRLTGKDYDAGKDWGQEEKQVTENEMVGQYQLIKEYEFEQTLWDSKGQGSLACCSPRGPKETWFID